MSDKLTIYDVFHELKHMANTMSDQAEQLVPNGRDTPVETLPLHTRGLMADLVKAHIRLLRILLGKIEDA